MSLTTMERIWDDGIRIEILRSEPVALPAGFAFPEVTDMGAAKESSPRAVRSLSGSRIKDDAAGVDRDFDDNQDDVSLVREWIAIGDGGQMRRRQNGCE